MPRSKPASKQPKTAAPRLDAYRAKRSAERTPEPFGAPRSGARPRLFVVQKHAATKLHHDFRLEWGGTLWSWAIPHGPSLDPAEKRLAVHVEDHPVEYADFEGLIPEGNYGAGAVIVWDRGMWIPYEDPDVGIQEGKLHFELRGYKMRGVWTLIRLKGGKGKDWLLIKKPDAWASKDASFDEGSILSGVTLEEMRDGSKRAATLRARLKKLAAPQHTVTAQAKDLMLAEVGSKPFSAAGWIFELKYDGYRLLAERQADGQARLVYRGGGDVTSLYPDLARAVRALPCKNLVLDGELVVLDEQSRPDFARLQRRARTTRSLDIERATVELPATLFVFDLLGFEDYDLRPLPLRERKALLREILPNSGPLRFADHVETRGEDFYASVSKLGLEGVMAKRADTAYRAGRSPHWLKLRADRTGDFAVVGWTAPQGSRSGFGALHVAAYDGKEFVYAGRVGTGFDDRMLGDIFALLQPLRVAKPMCSGDIPAGREHFWIKPELVAEVRYKTWTRAGHLRQPVFVRLRDDKRPEECTVAIPHEVEVEPPVTAAVEPETRTVRFTNLGKIFWPQERITKGDLIEYHRTIAPWILPYLLDRPLVVTRYPDGIEGKSFYQKNAPDYAPSWVRTQRIWSEHAGHEIDYFVCDHLDALLYVINMGAIPLHVWSSRTAAIQAPDWCILDFDPKGAPFAHVVKLALATHALCDDIGLPSYIKTSGATGLHVLIPLGGQCTYEQSRTLAHLIARVILAQHMDIATIARTIGRREGRVYLDYLQNRHGQLLVSPFCVRPLPAAPVSTPLTWDEVTPKLDPRHWNIRSVPERMQKRGEDPLLPVLQVRPDLVAALSRLARHLEEGAPRPAPASAGDGKKTRKPSVKAKPSK